MKFLALAIAFILAAVLILGKFPQSLLWLYLSVSLVTFCIYAFDKLAAQKRTYRVPEKTLHLLSLLGGWPGALLAQEFLRHKTSKQSFRLVYWTTVIVNTGGMIFLLSQFGKMF